MVNKCCAYGCKTGYKGHTTTSVENITLHKFPRDETLCAKWIRANPRKDFIHSKHSRMCSLHFTASDFVNQHQDSNPRRRKKFVNQLLTYRYLKKHAVPSIFNNAPSYLSTATTMSQPRPSASAATASGRRLKEAEDLELLYDSFQVEDNLEALTPGEILKKLQNESTAPVGYHVTVVNEQLCIYRLKLSDSILNVKASIIVKPATSIGLTVTVSIDNKIIPSAHYQDILSESKGVRLKYIYIVS